MITIFGGWPMRSQRVTWLLEEMGIPYRLRPVDLRNRASDSEFLALNPAGFVPVMCDGDVTMVESGAIAEYVIGRYGPTPLAPPSSDPAFPLYQQFLHLGEAGLASYLNIVVASRFFAPDDQKDNFGAQVAVRLFMSRLDLVTRRLAVSPYLAGEHFTAADISVVYALEMGQRLGLADRYAPAIADYMERLALRDCYKRAVEKSRP